MKVTMMLADAAQAVGGKLYILGGGWSVTGPQPSPFAIALKIEVPWDEANRPHEFALSLVNADGQPVVLPTPGGEAAVEVKGNLEVGRPAGLKPGTPLDSTLAINFGPLSIPPGGRYLWRLSIDGRTSEEWEVAFSTRPAAAGQPSRER
jgi:hypothetical protein